MPQGEVSISGRPLVVRGQPDVILRAGLSHFSGPCQGEFGSFIIGKFPFRTRIMFRLPVILTAALFAAQVSAPGRRAGSQPSQEFRNGCRRPVPPARDPHTPGFVAAKEMPDGEVPPADADGNFILGPTHKPAAEMLVQPGVPQGTVYNLTMKSADSRIYPGIRGTSARSALPIRPTRPGSW